MVNHFVNNANNDEDDKANSNVNNNANNDTMFLEDVSEIMIISIQLG